MITLDDGPVEVKILSAGTNWMKVGSMLAHGLTGYYGPLPEGSTVSVHAGNAGKACLTGPADVDAGRYHFAFSSPPWLVRTAMEGRGSRGYGEKPARLRAVAVLPHFDQLALAVRSDLGITSIRQMVEQKAPLRISTAPTHLGHPVGWVLDVLLAEYGIALEDFERWGGSVVYNDRQPNALETVPKGNVDRVSAMKAGALDAVFDEALMTVPWKQVTDAVDLTFLPIDRDVLETLDRKYGVKPALIPKNRLRGVKEDLPTIEFSGWCIYCHQDVPDRLVYLLLQGLEQQRSQIESMFQPNMGLTSAIDVGQLWRGAELPLHPGAQQFYREKGTLQ